MFFFHLGPAPSKILSSNVDRSKVSHR